MVKNKFLYIYIYTYCLQNFSDSRILEYYVKIYRAIDHTKSYLLPEENKNVNFQNFKRLTKLPFIA